MEIKFLCQTKQNLIIAYFFILNFPGAAILDFMTVIWLLYCFTQKNFCLLTIAATIWRDKIQHNSAQEI